MDCEFCNLNFESSLIFDTKYWLIILANEQSTLGRLLVILKSHKENLSSLTKEESDEFIEIVKRVENGVKKSFKADLFNWSCLMNNAYKLENPTPHVHWHCRPRYKNEIIFNKITFKDKDFGSHYDNKNIFKIDEVTEKKIILKLRENIE